MQPAVSSAGRSPGRNRPVKKSEGPVNAGPLLQVSSRSVPRRVAGGYFAPPVYLVTLLALTW